VPGEKAGWQWLCLEHVREFNQRYNYFDGMTVDEIHAAQSPTAGWASEVRAFRDSADRPPKWADFADPLEAISGRFGRRQPPAGRRDGKPLSEADRKALGVLGLAIDSDLKALRARYSELVRRYHPDRNGGDRSHEADLQKVLAAWAQLRKSPAFA
jgi:DnaJ-domain-containing protein 1